MPRALGLLALPLALGAFAAGCQRPTGIRPPRQPALADFHATSAQEDVFVSDAMNHEEVPPYLDLMQSRGWLVKGFEPVEGSPGRYIITLRRPWRRR